MMRPQTATQLFAGVEQKGKETCFYCGGSCEPVFAAEDHVKESFTGLDTVTLSDWVCPGCIAAMQEDATIHMDDGATRDGQRIRGYSWIITSKTRLAMTKTHRQTMLDLCLNPPEPPFVISISDSGQKHLLYRAIVNSDRENVTVTLEGQIIHFHTDQLRDRINLCKKVCAVTGKVALADTLDAQTQMRVVEAFGESLLAAWLDCCSEPLTRLAVWLCPPKEICIHECLSSAEATGD